jgi:hypothetical protein
VSQRHAQVRTASDSQAVWSRAFRARQLDERCMRFDVASGALPPHSCPRQQSWRLLQTTLCCTAHGQALLQHFSRHIGLLSAGLDGTPYLYTLALACPSVSWDDMKEGFQKAVDSFELLPPGKGYVPPDKDPWLFF